MTKFFRILNCVLILVLLVSCQPQTKKNRNDDFKVISTWSCAEEWPNLPEGGGCLVEGIVQNKTKKVQHNVVVHFEMTMNDGKVIDVGSTTLDKIGVEEQKPYTYDITSFVKPNYPPEEWKSFRIWIE